MLGLVLNSCPPDLRHLATASAVVGLIGDLKLTKVIMSAVTLKFVSTIFCQIIFFKNIFFYLLN